MQDNEVHVDMSKESVEAVVEEWRSDEAKADQLKAVKAHRAGLELAPPSSSRP